MNASVSTGRIPYVPKCLHWGIVRTAIMLTGLNNKVSRALIGIVGCLFPKCSLTAGPRDHILSSLTCKEKLGRRIFLPNMF